MVTARNMRFTCAAIMLLLCAGELSSQSFKDTIFTTGNEVIICQVAMVNETDVYYKYQVDGKPVLAYIPKSEIRQIRVGKDEEGQFKPGLVTGNAGRGLVENEGLIYPDNLELPPRFLAGKHDLYHYLEKMIPVRTRELRVFGNRQAIICLKLEIDSTGRVNEVTIEESATEFQGFHLEARHFEESIRYTLERMPLWNPPVADGLPVGSTVYLPLRFRIDSSRLVLLPAKYLYLYKNRHAAD